MSQYFPELYEHSGGNVKVELDLFNYATKATLEGATGIDTSTMASKTDLAGFKTKLDNLDVDKLKAVPVNLHKRSNVVDNNVLKRKGYDKLVIKFNVIDTKIPCTSGLVTKTQYDSDKQGLEKKIEVGKKTPNTSGLVKKTDCNAKLTETGNKIHSIA